MKKKTIILFLIISLLAIILTYFLTQKNNQDWGKEEQKSFLTDCLENIQNTGIPEDKSEKYCKCMLNNIQKKWSFEQTEKEDFFMDVQTMLELSEPCLNPK